LPVALCFDCRLAEWDTLKAAFQVIIWRTYDCKRNAISNAARRVDRSWETHHTQRKIDLLVERGEMPTDPRQLYGSLWELESKEKPLTSTTNPRGESVVPGKKWDYTKREMNALQVAMQHDIFTSKREMNALQVAMQHDIFTSPVADAPAAPISIHDWTQGLMLTPPHPYDHPDEWEQLHTRGWFHFFLLIVVFFFLGLGLFLAFVGPCSPNPCGNSGRCIASGSTSYTCTCASGYYGNTCTDTYCQHYGNPCANGGTCVSAPGATSEQCECASGYYGATCELTYCQYYGLCQRIVSSSPA